MLAKKHHWVYAAVFALFFLGTIVRFANADHPGSPGDLAINQNWMRSTQEHGIIGSFSKQVDGNMLPNHGPLEIVLYAFDSELYRAAISTDNVMLQPWHMIFSKVHAILFDLLAAAVIGYLFFSKRGLLAGLIASAVVLFHPGIFLDSTLWGQTDIIFTLFTFVALVCIASKQPLSAGVAFALAVLHKPQALIFLPLLLFLASSNRKRLSLFILSTAAVLGLTALVFLTHEKSFEQLLAVYTRATESSSDLSLNAYNLWWATMGEAARGFSSKTFFISFFTYRHAGTVFFGIAYLAILLGLRPRLRALHPKWRFEAALEAGALVTMAFFLFNASMHERYMFSFFLFALPLLFRGKGWMIYTTISVLYFLNLAIVLPIRSLPPLLGWFEQPLKVLISWGLLLSFVVYFANTSTEWMTKMSERITPFLRSFKKNLRGDVFRFPKPLERIISALDPVLIAAVALALVIRAYNFGAIPTGLNQDEASTAYDAFAILRYGIDRNGFPYPVMLVSWGSGMYALASYVAIPFFWMFGLTVWSARFPHLLLGLAGIPLFYLLGKDIGGQRLARIAAVMLAINPWHIMISRWGLDSNVFPTFFLLGTVLLLRSLKRPWLLLPSFAVYALCLYAYGTAYVVIAVFLPLTVLTGLWKRAWPWKTVIAACFTFAVVAMPIVCYLYINTAKLDSIVTPYFSIPRLSGTPRYEMANAEILKNLYQAWKLMIEQRDDAYNAISGYGMFYLWTTPLILLGLFLVGRQALKKPTMQTLVPLFWLVAGIAMTALLYVNVNRANILMLPLIFFLAVALSALWNRTLIVATLSVFFVLSFGGFTHAYFTRFPEEVGGGFNESFDEAIKDAVVRTEGPICITDQVNMPYIFVLFHTRENPHVFANTVVYDNPGAEFQGVKSFGRYTFRLNRCAEGTDVFIAKREEESQFSPNEFSITQYKRFSVVERKK